MSSDHASTLLTLMLDLPDDARSSGTLRAEPEVSLLDVDRLSTLVISDGGDGRIPDLQPLRVLGVGGMGTVLLARQRGLDREVAIKTVPADSRAAVRALLLEASHAGRLEHPNIVPVYLLGADAHGAPVMVMRRVDGKPWSQVLGERATPMTELAEQIDVLIEVCNAVAHAHARGVVHRDLKPSNVMIGAFGDAYLMDWGCSLDLATLATGPGSIVGTPAYMAPEMLGGAKAVTVRTDVYLLGATLHHLLTGEPPHSGSTLTDVLLCARASVPHDFPPQVPRRLAEVRNRAMAPDPADRYPTVVAMIHALNAWRTYRSAEAIAHQAEERLRTLRRLVRDRAPDATIGECFAACTFGFQLALRDWPDNPDARAGITAAIVVVASYELDRGRVHRAAALLDPLDAPPEDLVARLRAARSNTAPAKNPNPVLRVAVDGRLIEANAAAGAVLAAWGVDVGGAAPPAVEAAIGRAIASSAPTRVEVETAAHAWELTVAPIADTGEAWLYGIDVSALRDARRAVETLARFPKENPNPVMRALASGALEYANEAAAPVLAAWGVRVGDVPSALAEPIRTAQATGKRVTIEVLAHDRIYDLVVTPVPGVDYLYLYGRDVTDLRLAQRRTEELARFPEENPNPVMRVGGDGRIDYANPASRAMLAAWGITAGDLPPGAVRDVFDEAARTQRVTTTEVVVGRGVFVLSATPVGPRLYVYGRRVRELPEDALARGLT